MNISLYVQEVQNWIEKVQSDRGRNPKQVLENCDKIEKYGRQIHDDALIGFACFSRGETYYLMNDARNFYTQMLACLPSMEKIGEWGYVVMANNMLGIMSLNRGNAPFAVDYYMKAMSYCEKYHLPDLEWVVHMNMGALYLNIGENQRALDHLKSGYHYILSHPDMPDYILQLTAVYLNMAKAYLNLAMDETHHEMMEMAEKYNHSIDIECKPHLEGIDRLVVACFQARLFRMRGEKNALEQEIAQINHFMRHEIPVMDIYDDVYDYMVMLLTDERYDDFINCYKSVDASVEKTSIKNLQKRHLTLLIRYYKATGNHERYQRATVMYYEISEQMERENGLMVANMIQMRNSLNDLMQQNWEVEQENIALHRKSEVDALTGIYNRFKLNDYGEMAFANAEERKQPLAIEILDIDYFKEYNDNYGHQAGDEALKMVAQMMQKLQQKGKVFCSRYGGDEFVLIYEGLDEEQTYDLARSLQHSIEEQAIEHRFSKTSNVLTISQGICWGVPVDGNKVWDFLHRADELLYQVKKVSRNAIRFGHLKDSE